jgi:hypothetical protein
VRTLWESVDDRLFTASLELWVAARYDVPLREALLPLERELGREINDWVAELFGPMAANPRFPVAIELLLDAMRGASMRADLRSASSTEQLITEWVRMTRDLLTREAV